jgi:nucleoside-diphosphate-sugar epimerase
MQGSIRRGINAWPKGPVISRILVTGAAVAQWQPVIRQLLAAGHDVRVMVRDPDVVESLAAAGAKVVVGDNGDLKRPCGPDPETPDRADDDRGLRL